MNTHLHPQDLVITLTSRSICAVQVAACVVDRWGIFAWGINHAGWHGLGECAEQHCLSRANRKRLPNAVMYVAAKRKRNGKIVTARPCLECQGFVKVCKDVVYRDGEGEWCSFSKEMTS